MKVALVYDRVNKWGGAERVLLALHKIFPHAPLYTSVYNGATASWANKIPIKTSFLQKFPFSKKHELLAPLMPMAFEEFTFDGFDLVISVTSEAAKGIITKPSTKHICICLTPTRYLWSGYDEYFSSSVLRFFSFPVVSYLRMWDKVAATRPDTYVAISQEVEKRIQMYYKRDAEIVYPSLDETFLVSSPSKNSSESFLNSFSISPNSYFLVVARLSRFTSYKRVDQAIAAANALSIPLIVAGDGDIAYFSSRAGPTVTFTGKVSDEQLKILYSNCKALIFPAKEDFGLVMAEVQACGRPVIAYGKGGAAEIVIHKKTGFLYEKQTTEALISALKNFNEKDYNSKACIENAKRFSFEQFEKKLQLVIAQVTNSTSN